MKHYDDWRADCHRQLVDDFVEEHCDEFEKFCDKIFDEWRKKNENKKHNSRS